VFALAFHLSQAEAASVVSNLDPAGGDIQPQFSGMGAAVGFTTGPSTYSLDSVTLELYGYGGPDPYFHVQLYSLGAPGSVPAPGWPLVPSAELFNTGTASGATLVSYAPGAPVTLSPNHTYFIGATVSLGGSPTSLMFAPSEAYNTAQGWQMYVAPQSNNQWKLDESSGLWISGAPSGFEGLKLEIDATAVPEPGSIALGFAALLLISRARRCR